MSSEIEAIDRIDYQSKVVESEGPVVVQFGAAWCDVTQQMGEELSRLADDYGADIYSVDIDEEGRLTQDHRIADVPTYLAYFRGNIIRRIERPEDANQLEAFFESVYALDAVT
jgi:thioredoxin 1